MERSLREAVEELEARLAAPQSRRFPILGLKGAAGALLLREAVLHLERPILAVTPLAAEAEALAREVSFFLDEGDDRDGAIRRVRLLPSWELKPFAHLSPSVDRQAAIHEALYALLRLSAPLVVTSVDALAMRVTPRAEFDRSVLKVGVGDRLDLALLVEALELLGFQRVPLVEEVGDFSVRGGIVDIFTTLSSAPVRLELEGDVVASLRRFDPATQRSVETLAEMAAIPVRHVPASRLKETRLREHVALRAAEIGMVRKEVAELDETLANGLLFPGAELLTPYLYTSGLSTVFEYLPENTLLWLIEPGRVYGEASGFAERLAAEAEAAQSKPVFYPRSEELYLSGEELQASLDRFSTVETGSLITILPQREGWAAPIEIRSHPSLKLEGLQSRGERNTASFFEPLVEQLREIRRKQGRALMVVEGPSQVMRLRRHLEAYDLEVNTECPGFAALLGMPDFRPAIMTGEISTGTALEADGLYVYSEEDIFGEPRIRRRSRPLAKGALLHLDELHAGDLVVHLDHGIGKYRGLKHLRVAGIEGDFLNLEYAGNDTMYLPVERINLVQRYVGGQGEEPKLDRLGSGSWERVKRRTRESVLAMANELLEVYAARAVHEGHPFPHPGPVYHEFCERFEFEETPDQAAAIDSAIEDMSRPRPMDRLVCGDAGFGKTEVALRAAFIAAMDGRQVALLVPTTVLAEQHWNTFRARFAGYPVQVEMVSRFRTARENRAVIDGLRRGTVDIAIGTHRLLQSDIEFKRLGLLIIDEEHRFGVKDKERIKRLRKTVDVLTLTATPIPRTLHMAMLGIRDLSVIQTPPPDRQVIRTFIAHFDDGLLRDVILRELNRGGQVFFVHNRVDNIDAIARHVRAVVPEARVVVAHGQMKPRELERVMRDFVEKRVNVLVCSAIIESGLDIANANTMIINRADHFGLAQLYQLRGRIGRSRQRAYAYLLVPGEHIITRDAKRRIEALRELVESDSGIGFKLAMHDLEHRGAGNLLGREQSGQIAAVGFELYTDMLEQAIHELRGEPHRPALEPELKLEIPAYIPEELVPDETDRLALYRRLARAESTAELAELRDEMCDRFGPVPPLVENLIAVMNLRRLMREMMVVGAIRKGGDEIEIRFHPDAPVDPARLTALVDRNRRLMRLAPPCQVVVKLTGGVEPAQMFDWLGGILQALRSCETLEGQTAGLTGELLN